jgi:hypothetical protein
VVNKRGNLITYTIIIIMPYETWQKEKQHKTLKVTTTLMYRPKTWTSTGRSEIGLQISAMRFLRSIVRATLADRCQYTFSLTMSHKTYCDVF